MGIRFNAYFRQNKVALFIFNYW